MKLHSLSRFKRIGARVYTASCREPGITSLLMSELGSLRAFELDRTPSLPTEELSISREIAPTVCRLVIDMLDEMIACSSNACALPAEELHILRYTPGRYDRLSPHVDNSRWTAVFYPTGGFVGGELLFPHLGFAVAPMPGLVLAFPGDEAHLHCSLPVKSGVKLACTAMVS